MARTRGTTKAVAAETETDEAEGGIGRGPGILATAMAEWITETYNVKITAEQVYLAQSKRKEFRASAAYEDAVEEIENAKENKASEKEQRAAARATKAAAESEDDEKPARRSKKAAPAAEPEAEPTPKARKGRRATATTEVAEEAPAAPAKRGRAKATKVEGGKRTTPF